MSTQIRSYMIYNPVYRQIRKFIKRKGYRNYIVNTWNVCLDKFSDVFDMRLVWVNGDDSNFINFMDELTILSNCFHFWNKSPTISVEESDFEKLQTFIQQNNLWDYIEKIQTRLRLSLVRVTIKIITFHPKILSTNMLPQFEQPPNYVEHRKSLYIAKAYGWLTPSGLNHFKTKIRYKYTHVVIYLLLDYHRMRRRRRNISVFNLFDLCALRLAMFDPRYYQYDQCEIPRMIHAEIRDTIEQRKISDPDYTYNATTYFIEQAIEYVSPRVAELFIIYVSDYCDFVSETDLISINYSYILSVDDYVGLYGEKLYEEFLIDFIRKRPFLLISVFCQTRGLSFKLFRDILDLRNVFSMNINTNFPVELETSKPAPTLGNDKKLALYFNGDSETNYLASYIIWLKPHAKCRLIDIHIRCAVADYTIFNGLEVEEVIFSNHVLNTQMIAELCTKEPTTTTYIWEKATLQKNTDVLKTLHDFRRVQKLDIVLDENTFELIFIFIESLFWTHDRSELEFGGDLVTFTITILTDVVGKIVLSDYIFKLNSDRVKIELYDKRTNNVVDLYDILFETSSMEPRDEYEFYQ